MTIRTKLKLWYALMAASGVLLIAFAFVYEIVIEGHLLAEGWWSLVAEIAFWTRIAALLIFGGWAWLGVMNRSTRTLEHLSQAAESINSGNLHERIPITGRRDELDRLAAAFNSMLSRIEAAFGHVRDFTLDASHELKTPLSILRHEMEPALADPELPVHHRERVARQIEEIDRLTLMVDGLSVLTQVETGLLNTTTDKVRLEELVAEACADIQVLGVEKHVTVSVDHIEPCAVLGDRNRLRQLLLNLSRQRDQVRQPGRSGGF